MSAQTAINVAGLPTTMKRLIGAMGVSPALRLLQARGGTRFYLGGRRGRRDRRLLADLVGRDAAEGFYREFQRDGATEVTLPKADKILIQVRDAEIRADQEHSLMELAMLHRLTSRQIQNIRSRAPEAANGVDERQIDLFSGSDAESDPMVGVRPRLNAV